MQMLLRRTFYGLERQAILIDDSHFLIGRSMDCQLRPFSPLVSQHHCEIELKEDIATVRDLWSRHGTYVNGRRIDRVLELNSGDTLGVGLVTYQVALLEESRTHRRDRVPVAELRVPFRHRWAVGRPFPVYVQRAEL